METYKTEFLNFVVKEEILGKKNGENLERKELLAFSLTIAPGTSLSS